MKLKTAQRQVTLFALFMMLFGFIPVGTFGQDSPRPRTVAVVPPANRSGEPSLDSVGITASQTIEHSLMMLDDFEVRPLANEIVPPAVVDGEPAALAQFAREEVADYVMFGSVSKDQDERIVIEMAVWDGDADSVALQARQTASSLFDTFTVADELAFRFLSAFSGRRIAFGSIQLEPDGWDEGSYTVLVDGMEIAVDTRLIPQVLIGDRTIEVMANNGPEPGAVLVSELVTVREAESTPLAFTFPEPEMETPSGEVQSPPIPAVTQIDSRSRLVALRLQSGGGFLGAGGLDFYPGRGSVRTGIVAGGTVIAEEPTPAIAVALAVEPSAGRLILPIGVSSYVTATNDAVTAAVGVSMGIGVRFRHVLHELFLDNIIYFNAYPTTGLPLVYMPVIGVRL